MVLILNGSAFSVGVLCPGGNAAVPYGAVIHSVGHSGSAYTQVDSLDKARKEVGKAIGDMKRERWSNAFFTLTSHLTMLSNERNEVRAHILNKSGETV
jgi:hypothetical protein